MRRLARRRLVGQLVVISEQLAVNSEQYSCSRPHRRCYARLARVLSLPAAGSEDACRETFSTLIRDPDYYEQLVAVITDHPGCSCRDMYDAGIENPPGRSPARVVSITAHCSLFIFNSYFAPISRS